MTNDDKYCIFITEHIKRFKKEKIMKNTQYTEMQQKIINGEIPLETVGGHALRWLHEKALAKNDDDLVKKVESRIAELKEEKRRLNIQRTVEREKKRQLGTYQWCQPRSNEYSDHQKQIVRGEIPYESVHTNELISIHQKAHNLGDYELSERIWDLIYSRRQEAAEKKDQVHKAYNKAYRKAYGKTRQKTKGVSSESICDEIMDFNVVEQAYLSGYADIYDCSEDQLEHMLEEAKKQNNEDIIKFIVAVMKYKKNPELAYTVQDHRAAIARLGDLLNMPIRRPETWFVEG